MPISKISLTDVNIWLALVAEGHAHHRVAREWFLSLGDREAVFCRVSQMGLLRLLTQPAVMNKGALSPEQAWRTYEVLRQDSRVAFVGEPMGLESIWMRLMNEAASGQAWTDAYLAAFALGHQYTLVSFDRGFRRWQGLSLRLLNE
jgi:toxin-antitoxin system PIN domain toxin